MNHPLIKWQYSIKKEEDKIYKLLSSIIIIKSGVLGDLVINVVDFWSPAQA